MDHALSMSIARHLFGRNHALPCRAAFICPSFRISANPTAVYSSSSHAHGSQRSLAWRLWRARRVPPVVSPVSHPSPRRPTRRSVITLTLIAFLGGSVAGFYLYDPDNFNHNRLAFIRSYRAAQTGLLIALDYKWTLRKGPEIVGQEEYERVKGECHQRAANRLLELCKTNQGIYIKLVRVPKDYMGYRI